MEQRNHQPLCQVSPMVSSQAMISVQEIERARLEMQTEFFLRSGGKIEQVDSSKMQKTETRIIHSGYESVDEKRKKGGYSSQQRNQATKLI